MMQKLLLLIVAMLVVIYVVVPTTSQAQTTVRVTFQVNMRVKILEQTFKPDSDFVSVPGNFNGWTTTADTLTDPNHDSIYTKTITLKADTLFEYKFFKNVKRGGNDWEGISANRRLATTTRDTTLRAAWFDDDSIVSVKTSGNILFQTDMRVMEQLGIFQRTAGDSLRVRGDFNNWGTDALSRTAMERIPGTEQYQLSVFDSGFTGDVRQYKYYMQIDSARALARWSGFNSDRDGFRYEHPYDMGDGNRRLTVQLGNYTAPMYYFNSLAPKSLIPAADTIWVLFRYNMKPAMTFADPFNPAKDTVFLLLQDRPWHSMQGYPFENTRMQFVKQNDSIWALQMAFIGLTTNGIMYRVRYSHGDSAGTVDEGGGLGAAYPYRVRYMKFDSTNVTGFAKRDTLPIDVWQKNAPMPVEPPPFTFIVTGVRNIPSGVPEQYVLGQNYPNPFNPTTKIRYEIMGAADVRLTIYDMLGREVTTLVNEHQPAGVYEADFRAANVSSGVYYYTLKAGSFIETKKMILIK